MIAANGTREFRVSILTASPNLVHQHSMLAAAARFAVDLDQGGQGAHAYASVNKKLIIVPEEAETVREIFRRYLELGAVRLLAADLDKSGIKPKIRDLSGGRTSGGGRFGVGALSHFLKNRFYIGEIAYRGEMHPGEQEPILDRAVFEEVQAKLLRNNVERRLKLKTSLSLLAGRIYGDRGNRMLPSHTVKNGV